MIEHVAHLLQLHQQAVMTGRVTGRVEHDHGAVAEHVLVAGTGSTLPPPLIQLANGAVLALRRLGVGQHVPVALADQQRGLRERADLAGVVTVVVADGDVLDLSGVSLSCASRSTRLTLGATSGRGQACRCPRSCSRRRAG